jgi:PAS domain S-box-containing protein
MAYLVNRVILPSQEAALLRCNFNPYKTPKKDAAVSRACCSCAFDRGILYRKNPDGMPARTRNDSRHILILDTFPGFTSAVGRNSRAGRERFALIGGESRKDPRDSMQSKSTSNETVQQARKHPRSARAIGESEEWLFTTLESIGDGVIATDAQGAITFMNLVAVTLTGWSEEEAQGRACHEVFHIVNESTRMETECPVVKVVRDGVVCELAKHTVLIARDGIEHNIDDSSSPIRNKAGLLIGVVLIFRDVTERRKSEQTLQEQQEILQTLFDHIPVIVTFLDAQHQCKWVNQEWTRVLGWSLEDMRDSEHLKSFAPCLFEEQDTANPSPQKLASGWRDLTLTAKEGHNLDLSWTVVFLSDGTSIGIGKDITQRKRTEVMAGEHITEVEMRNLRLEQAMRESDHRVKNNLQAVAALLDMQVMNYEAAVPVRELTQIRTHIHTLATIHDMLVADVKEEGTVKVISAKEALEKLLPMLQQLVGDERIHWSADEVLLPVKQGISLAVLINELINNAVKHGGQKVELRLAVVEKDVLLEVQDDGPGFSQAFNPLNSAHFGLELVESVGRLDLGGSTTYENRPEGGARVRVIFPLPVIHLVFTP